ACTVKAPGGSHPRARRAPAWWLAFSRPWHRPRKRTLGEGMMDKQAVVDATRRWIASMVVGLNLCPFARRAFAADAIRYAVSDAADEAALREDLARELRTLAASPRSVVETAFLI